MAIVIAYAEEHLTQGYICIASATLDDAPGILNSVTLPHQEDCAVIADSSVALRGLPRDLSSPIVESIRQSTCPVEGLTWLTHSELRTLQERHRLATGRRDQALQAVIDMMKAHCNCDWRLVVWRLVCPQQAHVSTERQQSVLSSRHLSPSISVA